MLESHQHQDTVLVDNGLNASASTIPWQIWSYTKCLKPFFICESSLWWSSIAFSLALIVKYFAGFQSISIPALSPSLILFVFIIRPRIISSLACLPCLIQLVLSPSRRFFAYFFPLHPSVAPSISRGLRFVVAEAHEHRLKVGFYITIYVKKSVNVTCFNSQVVCTFCFMTECKIWSIFSGLYDETEDIPHFSHCLPLKSPKPTSN